MINHARTLLMNVDGTIPFDNVYVGDEIIDPDFVSLRLTSGLARIRRIIFGTNPDREMLNYRCYQLLNMLRETDLQGFVEDLDNRITYDFTSSPFLDGSIFLPTLTQLSGDPKIATITGGGLPPDPGGKLKQTAHVAIGVGPSTYSTSVEIEAGLSAPIAIPGTSNYLLIQTPEVGDEWRITWRTRPVNDLGRLVPLLEEAGGEALIDLFNRENARGAAEPFRTFRLLFEDHFDLPHRLGGAALALIYRSEEIRVA